MNEGRRRGLSRRSFLKALSAAAAAGAGMSLPSRAAGAATAGGLATLIDLSLCDGCPDRAMPACVAACRDLNKDRIPPIKEPIPEPWPQKRVEDWSRRREVFDRLTPYNFLYVHRAELEEGGRKRTVFVPRRCMHCDNPACATICPFSANHKFETGAVVIDQDLCFGGAKCRDVCPWAIPQRQSGVGIYLHVLPSLAGNGVMFKCDLCQDRLLAGKRPVCIDACPTHAMIIGPRREIYAEARRRAQAMGGHIYGDKENGGTSTLYVSPVAFSLLDGTMKREPGRPDMKPHPRRMAQTDPAGKAVLSSPLWGIVAGTAGAFWSLRRRRDRRNDNGGGEGK